MKPPLLTTARRTAALLGRGWKAAPEEPAARPGAVLLTAPRKGGDSYRIRLTGEGARILAYGHLDTSADRRLLYSADAPKITIAADLPARRVPYHLASHLRRRMLPLYESALTALADDRARYAREMDARDAVAERLRDILPGAYVSEAYRERDHVTVTSYSYGRGRPQISATVRHDGESVRMELDYLTPDQAEAVCRALAPAGERKP
ncbi:hypothetical protein [Streptomyces sp. NPDC048442]|uniref:hypothetical protein n=1 Tax=Streptomyces sp. NPDC048442 TaxID=3154823 RepID=UPI0034211848